MWLALESEVSLSWLLGGLEALGCAGMGLNVCVRRSVRNIHCPPSPGRLPSLGEKGKDLLSRHYSEATL